MIGAATDLTAATDLIEATAVIAVIVHATGGPAMTPKAARRRRRNSHGHVTARRRTPPVHSPPQELSVLRRQCAQDRLQRRQTAATVRIGARQDRSEPHHCSFGQ